MDELPNVADELGVGKIVIKFLKLDSAFKLLSRPINSCSTFFKS